MNPINLINTLGSLVSARISDSSVDGRALLAADLATQKTILGIGILDDSSITTVKIANEAISEEKLSTAVQSKLNAVASGATPYPYRAYYSPQQPTVPDIVDLLAPLHIKGILAAGDNASGIQFELRKFINGVYTGQGRVTYQALNRAIFALTQADYDQGIQVAYWVTPIDNTKFASVRLVVQDTAENTQDPVVATPAIDHTTPTYAESVAFSADAANNGYLTVPLGSSAYAGGLGIVFWCYPELANPQGYWLDFRDAVNGNNGYFLGDGTVNCTVTVRDSSNNVANRNALVANAGYRFVVNTGALGANSVLTFLNRWTLNERATGRRIAKIAIYNRPLTQAETDNVTQRPPDSALLAYYSLNPKPTVGQTTYPDTSGNNRTATLGGF